MRHSNISVLFLAVLASFLAAAPVGAQNLIDVGTVHQSISGFGGINFPRWIKDMTMEQTDLAFGNDSGQLGLSILRVSVAPDRANWWKEIPVAKRAQSHGAKVFATPWSPPASMTSNGKIVDGKLDTASYAAYARYLTDFVDSMEANGVDLYAISIQNEPDVVADYESCRWTADEIRNFVVGYAGRIPCRVIASESYRYDKSYTDLLLDDPAAAANFDIVGVHIYSATPSVYPLARAKGKEVWMTEHYTTSDRSANLWPDALEVAKEIHACMASDFSAYVWWYIRRVYGLITDDGSVSKRGWVFAHFSKFVRPGFVRVEMPEIPSAGVLATAYAKGGEVVVVLVNQTDSVKSLWFRLVNNTVPMTSLNMFTTSGTRNMAEDGPVGVALGDFKVTLDPKSVATLTSMGNIRGEPGPASETVRARTDEIFDLGGVSLGFVEVGNGQSHRTQLRKRGLRSRLFIAKSPSGKATLHVDPGF